MNLVLKTADMRSYLAANDWRRLPETWRGATLWEHPEGGRAMVPARDDFDDAAERSIDLVRLLAKVEGRSPDDIARDIASPLTDTQSYRIMPPGLPSGELSLPHGKRVFEAVTDLYAYAARAVMTGNRPAFYGKRPAQVDDKLAAMRLAVPTAGSYIVNVRVPVAQPDTLDGLTGAGTPERPIVDRLGSAIRALGDAVTRQVHDRAVTAFDSTVESGASANLCKALAQLSIDNEPFEVRFGWARGLPGQRAPEVVRFPEHAGELLKLAANRLSELSAKGTVILSGRISDLKDRPSRNDRWRIKIEGSLREQGFSGQESATLWARLTESDYDAAGRAHLAGRQVRVTGRQKVDATRREVIVASGDLEVL